MQFLSTLTRYITYLFLKSFAVTTLVIICLLLITQSFDTLQSFKSIKLDLYDFWQIVILKIPHLLSELSALICFISTFILLTRIINTNELIILLSCGVPIWRIFIIASITSFIIGIIFLCILTPISSYCLVQYDKLKGKLSQESAINFVISESGLFFVEQYKDHDRLIQGDSMNVNTKTINNVRIIITDKHNNPIKFIDADKAVIDAKKLKLYNLLIHSNLGIFSQDQHMSVTSLYDVSSSNKLQNISKSNKINNHPIPYAEFDTQISIALLIQRFIAPEKIPIWRMSDAIDNLTASGVVVTKYLLSYYKQLLQPIMMCVMSSVACWFVSFGMRESPTIKTHGLTILFGIIIYFLLKFSFTILAYNGVTPLLAVLLPMIFILLSSNFIILHMQEI